ncbi:hypothetical protein GEMRC1_007554 [Eukaryota sp. GEM-RC1]
MSAKHFIDFVQHCRLPIFFSIVFFFHISEFILSYIYHPKSTSWSSFLLSKPYLLAMTLALSEYSLYNYFSIPKDSFFFSLISTFGFTVVVVSDFIRKLSIITAGRSFSHQIATKKSTEHTLITSGIYSFSRHPSYFGWFYWSIGTQILLANPLSFVVFCIASWKFFADRIPYEERFLIHIFGQRYIDYKHRVPTRIPFMH